ncbi:S41 family peptidase [uncultured Flavobacterium sp.]|uniref:S41 family peptidase n=1 Tax=uncultured Flavobacterium sp. TaxID=165435 RepID=UPI0025E46953|nr:S41 family peptidase [uncultured Flavobacterium sp.]
MKKTLALAILLFLGTFTFLSCQDDYDDIEVPNSLKINDFIWKGLNLYYYWQADVPNLSDNKFRNQGELNSFLANYSTPENLFSDLLFQYSVTDRFSVMYSDYSVLEGNLNGITKNNGVDFQLARPSSNPDVVFGWVRYIIPNSDASTKDIRRGDIFYAIDGIPLRYASRNYNQLLAQETYTLNLANYDNGNLTPNGRSVTLTKTQLTENPILMNTVFTQNQHRIGYLMYNGFYSAYDNELNQVFASFKSQNITDLIIDLRYNSGGSVNTATRLASMITGNKNGQIFAKQQWNSKVQSYFQSNNPEQLVNRFTNSIDNTAINSLNLPKVYILTSKASASASELLINGLKPHLNVVQIGDVTTGKNVGSITLYDSPSFNKEGRSSSHRYAMQPICFKIVNSEGFGEYANGIKPDESNQYAENLGNLGALGNTSEPLLSKAIQKITGTGRPIENSPKNYEALKDSKSMRALGTELYLDEVPFEALNIKFYEN